MSIQQSSKGVKKFLDLTDTPATYIADYLVKVNNSQDGLDFLDPNSLGGSGNNYTFENGLIQNGSDIVHLGGTLIENTSINGSGNYWLEFITNSSDFSKPGFSITGYNSADNSIGTYVSGTAISGINSNGLHLFGNGSYSDVRISANKLLFDGLLTDNSATQVLGKDVNGFAKWRDVNSISGPTQYGSGYTKEWNGNLLVNNNVATFDISAAGFTNIISVQATAYLAGSSVTNAPLTSIFSVSTTSVTVNLYQSKTTLVASLNTNVEGLENHNNANTRVYLTVKGN